MYVSVRNVPVGSPPRAATRRVPRTVVVLGFVSLLTDVSTEMVTAVLPLFVTAGLGLSPLAFGVLDSVYQAGSAASRVAGGYAADRLRRPKAVATAGYALGMASKVLLLPAAGLGALSAAIGVDRIGKGLRTGPRDALIAAASAPEALGRSFGVHRALDTLGALLGPVLAFYLLLAAPGDFDMVFVVSACIAGLGVLLLVAKVAERPHGGPESPPRISLRGAGQLIARRKGMRRLMLAATVLSALTISDAFLYLALLEGGAVSSQAFPLLFLGTALVYLLAAVPLGELADRVGRARMFVAGHALIVCAYLAAGSASTWQAAALALGLLGLYYAATDGVLPAAASMLAPAEWRSTAISSVQTAVAVGRSGAALVFGSLWAVTGAATGLWLFAAALGVALLVVGPLLVRGERG
ncbi:MAG TPA: MFS transporter [Solirubrobacteraceae bacterium]|nr:MFS transporter [Solirubrobacteraceae bacterium]